ncbi:hypothetical protein [Rickettsia tamurae]|nr:hypothetical protein [Rickettsia tamurae]
MDWETHSVSYRGLSTGSKKQLKILTILVFLTGSRDQVAWMTTEKRST